MEQSTDLDILSTCCSRVDLSWKAALFLRDLDIPPPGGRGPGDS